MLFAIHQAPDTGPSKRHMLNYIDFALRDGEGFIHRHASCFESFHRNFDPRYFKSSPRRAPAVEGATNKSE